MPGASPEPANVDLAHDTPSLLCCDQREIGQAAVSEWLTIPLDPAVRDPHVEFLKENDVAQSRLNLSVRSRLAGLLF
jgi:hypothetical protein